MLSRRPLLFRASVAVLAGIVLCLLGFVGLGWAVRMGPPWVRTVMGYERADRLLRFYLKIAVTLFPGDRDGDGFCDGLELFNGTDPGDSSSHDVLFAGLDRGGLSVESDDKFSKGLFTDNLLILQPGEKTRAQIGVTYDVDVSFPAGFRLKVRPSSHLLVGPAGGALATNALLLTIPANHTFTFDLEIAPGTIPTPAAAAGPGMAGLNIPSAVEQITITNAATGEQLGTLQVWCVWKSPPVSLHVEIREPEPDQIARIAHLQWPIPSPPSDALMIEAAEDVANAEWFWADILSPTATNATMTQFLGRGYSGPLKYRVVPIRYFSP